MPPRVKRTEMNGTEIEFVKAYLISFNVVQASKEVGISARTGTRYLDKDYIQKHLADHAKKVQEISDISLAECINEVKDIAMFDHTSYAKDFNMSPEDGKLGVTLKDFKDMDTRLIQSMNVKYSGGIPYVEIKPYDKLAALKILIDHLKGSNGETNYHFHLDKDTIKDKTAQEVAAEYQVMVGGD